MTETVAITNVNIFSDPGFDVGTVLIRDGKIQLDSSAPSGANTTTVIDGTGKYLLPGFIDCHVHLGPAPDGLAELASYGVTTALDMACWPPAVWQALKSQTHGTCDFRTAGVPATCHGSRHAQVFGPLLAEHLIDTPEEAKAWIDKRISERSDYIKLVADSPVGPSQDTLNALTAAAHGHGKQVVCHAINRRAFEMAIEAQVDFVTHAPADEPLPMDWASRMKTQKGVAIPTLTIEESRAKTDNLNYAAARESVRLMYRAEIPVLAGTDSTGTLGPHPLPYGSTLHHEYELLVDAGLPNVDVIRATTSLAAQHFGLDDRGVIANGKRADLVLLIQNPLEDIRNTQMIERVWCAGVEQGTIKSS